MKLLKYVGSADATFLSPPIGTVTPGQELWVTDKDVERLIRRGDVEAKEGPSEDTEDSPAAESPESSSSVAETPTAPQDEGTPAGTPAPVRRGTKTSNPTTK